MSEFDEKKFFNAVSVVFDEQSTESLAALLDQIEKSEQSDDDSWLT
ncbi:hypothetical protein [Actinoplanes regularis]|nr:hypothetical protein [Actinoplanes regularis]